MGSDMTPAGRTRIERLIQRDGSVILPGCYDALSATIVQKTGFTAGFISGYCVSAAKLGLPDIGFLTPPEMAEAARAVCKAAPNIPFIADADTGGGNALNVQRTVKDLINAGAAGCFLEDQAWPKKCGHMRGKQVIPAEEHAAKIAAARAAIGDADFFLIARTDARAATGLDDAIARANLYMEAGADASFVEAPRNEEEMMQIVRRTRGYRVCNMIEGGATPLKSRKELQAMGFHVVINSLTALYASARSLMDMMKILHEEGTARDHLHKLPTFADFNELMGLEDWLEVGPNFTLFKCPAVYPAITDAKEGATKETAADGTAKATNGVAAANGNKVHH